MTKRHIKKLLKLEQILEKEFDDLYIESMVELFPMFDNRDLPIPSKQKIAHKIEKKLHDKHEELKSSKVLSSIIVRFVSKKYEVTKNASTLQRL